jgi:oligopeptide/dipeptide ABC transporter ATP-binding protein
MKDILLEVKNLRVSLQKKKEVIHIVDDISFNVRKGKTLCIVGESGCGKSLTSLSIMGLLPKGIKITQGEVNFKEKDLSKYGIKEMSKIRGNDMSMIFQEPMTSLNPVHTVGKQISESAILHMNLNKKEAHQKAIEMLRLVGIPSPESRVDSYPHELSGGMRQRVMIAIALICDPELIIADEPTTALDVTIQAQILELMNNLKEELGMSIVMITHDLSVVSEMADDVVVMYAGKIVEYGNSRELFNQPLHPYTEGLLNCIPTIDDNDREELDVIIGSVPRPDNMPIGCRFFERCPYARSMCKDNEPPLVEMGTQKVSCWKFTDQWEMGKESRDVDTDLTTEFVASE